MKTVTDDFLEAQIQAGSKPLRVVEYKRRKWNQTDQEFEWETNWNELSADLISNISPINWQLDTDQLNEFKVSNVTLVLRNHDGYFNTDNPDGLFAQDDDSPYNAYEPYWTKFRIRGGFILADGTEEVVTVFTGLLAPDPIYESEQKTAQFPLQGLEAILINTKASEMATHVDQENAGTGNSSATEFETDNPGVGGISLVTLDGVEQVEGDDYSVSQLNDTTLPAKVTFSSAPGVGVIVRISYYYWPQGYQFHELVEALLDAAGIDPGNQDVESVIFENSVLNQQGFNSKTEWETGTDSGLETTSSPGDLKIDWQAIKEAKTWSTSDTGWTNGSGAASPWASDGTWMVSQHTTDLAQDRWMYRQHTSTVGSWKFTFKMNNTTGLNTHFRVQFMSSNGTGASSGNKYWLGISQTGGGGINIFKMISGTSTELGSYGMTIADNTEYTVEIVRKPNGNMKVYIDGTLRIDVTNTEITTGTYFVLFRDTPNLVSNTKVSIKDFYVPPDTADTNWTSPVMDLNAAPSAWGSFDSDDSMPSGATLTYKTATSTDGMSFDAFVAISGNTPQSDFKRYAKIKAEISFSTVQSTLDFDPTISQVILRWSTSGVPVVLPAAFTGRNVYEAIQILGAFTNYEFGFGPDEVFFFRPKTPDSPTFTITQSDYNSKIYAKVPGYERVFGTVRVTYGDITKEVTDDGDHVGSPKARVNDNVKDFTADDGIVVAPSADIATGVARGLYAYSSVLRPRFKVATKFLPQIDLSDAVTVTHSNIYSKNKLWWLGDNNVNFGDKDVNLWGEKEQLAFNTPVKIIGARYDLERFGCEFDVEEVVS